MRPLYRVIVVALLISMVCVTVAYAADAPSTKGSMNAPGPVPIGAFTSALYDYALKIVGFCIFVMFLIAGLAYMIPALQKSLGNPIQIMQDAVIGLVILVSAYVILNSIHPNLVNIGDSTSTGLGNQSSGTSAGSSGAVDGTVSMGDNVVYVNGDTTVLFRKPNATCGSPIILSCQPGYTCQGGVCKWAGEKTVALNSFCQMTSQCAQPTSAFSESVVCVSVYEFRSMPGKVQKCCDGDSVRGTGGGNMGDAPYCTN